MIIDYCYINPTGNITLLVETPVCQESRPFIASELMKAEKDAEQVGFVNGKALAMAGGEFCGNATLSTAAIYCERNGLDSIEDFFNVSGVAEPVKVSLSKTAEHVYKGKVTMPKPFGVVMEKLPLDDVEIEVPVVKFPGIYHIMLEDYIAGPQVEKNAPAWCKFLGADALGVMYIDMAMYQITPLVYVPEGNTLVWENSCASGTSAVGVYLSHKEGKPVNYVFREPGGTLGIEADGLNNPVLSGRAEIMRSCQLTVDSKSTR